MTRAYHINMVYLIKMLALLISRVSCTVWNTVHSSKHTGALGYHEYLSIIIQTLYQSYVSLPNYLVNKRAHSTKIDVSERGFKAASISIWNRK